MRYCRLAALEIEYMSRLETLLEQLPDVLPNIWGEGLLFGFSGMDGPTETAGGFVATGQIDPIGLLFHTPEKRLLEIDIPESAEVRIATGDCLALRGDFGECIITWAAWHTVIAAMPESLSLRFGPMNKLRDLPKGKPVTFAASDEADCIVLWRQKELLSIGYGTSEEEALERCRGGMTEDPGETALERLDYLSRVPELENPEEARLLRKCVSVIKVNTLWPEGAMKRWWSTPDRVPHRHMWLWDSAFHSLAMNLIDPGMAHSFLRAVLDRVVTPEEAEALGQPELAGMIPHCMEISGNHSTITQPPVLAWAMLENLKHHEPSDGLDEILERLSSYLQWDMDQRDWNDSHLLEWFIEGDPDCRSGESGLDNSPRFDSATLLEAVDFSTLASNDMRCLAQLYRHVGDKERGYYWEDCADETEASIHEKLWNQEEGLYFDRMMSGDLSEVKAVTGFLPLLLKNLPPARVPKMQATLKSGDFYTAARVPSVARSDPNFGTDMWRGPVWYNLNYLIYRGLNYQECRDSARELRQNMIDIADKYYQQYGVTFEFYDALDQTPPPRCDRKGPVGDIPYLCGGKMTNIRDYHWTAAILALLLWPH